MSENSHLDRAAARSLVAAMLASREWEADLGYDDELMILDEHTIEEGWGWCFFYTSRRYHETGDFQHAFGGNTPIIVRRTDGAILLTGTALPTEHYIQELRANGTLP